MAHNIYVTGIYIEYQTKKSNSNLVSDEYFLNSYYYNIYVIIIQAKFPSLTVNNSMSRELTVNWY
jgi:hypothetical protein